MSGFLASANAGSLHEKANAACGGDRLLDPADKIRVALCDDHEPFRRGVAEMLSLAGDVEVIGRPSPPRSPVATGDRAQRLPAVPAQSKRAHGCTVGHLWPGGRSRQKRLPTRMR